MVKKLDLGKPLILLLLFVIGIAIIFTLLSQANSHRQEKIYQEYNEETQNYINQNQQNLTVLFTILRSENPPCTQDMNNPPYCPLPTTQEQINKLSQNLKDWSSTAFLYQSRFHEAVYITRLSGDTKQLYFYPQEKQLQVGRLLKGEINQLPWDDYTYELTNKEVIIPVKDQSGKVIGAIIRGVIEAGSF